MSVEYGKTRRSATAGGRPDGTGDQTTQTPFTTQTLNNMLSQLITVPTGTNMQLKTWRR
ncbi:hypothetical protein KCP73_23275 [Salmonella enterica subsp. enterica]|nr:hypothetical protein KCP73_23275 [Salmonella enterica subsp. enterica]